MKTVIITSAILIIVCLLFTIFGCNDPESMTVTVNDQQAFEVKKAEYIKETNVLRLYQTEKGGIEIFLSRIKTLTVQTMGDPNNDNMPLKVTTNGERVITCNTIDYNLSNQSLILNMNECGEEIILDEITSLKIELTNQ